MHQLGFFLVSFIISDYLFQGNPRRHISKMLNQLEMQGIGQDQCPVDFLLKFIVALNEAGLVSPQIYPPRLWRNKESHCSVD